ncbi:Ran GTPase activating protein [Carabus blaptoides fortunei]
MGDRLTENFLLLFCEKNSDGTKNLVLKGKDMFQRIGTRIKPNDMHKISDFLRKHPEVIGLNLCYNDISDKGFNILINNYLQNDDNTLLDLNLIMCDITKKSVINLVSLPTIKLRSLRLTGNKIGEEGGKQLAQMLSYTKTVLHLDIGETDQTLTSVQYFIKILNNTYQLNNTLRVLDLSSVIPKFNRYPYDSGHFAESIGNMLQYNESLIEIHLQKNEFDGHDIELMLLGFKHNKTLLMLDLGYNRIGDNGIEHIAHYLKNKSALLGLNVAGNGISNIGARALSFTMPFSRIRLLDIGYNKITDRGILDILNSIKKPIRMRVLNIWGNTMTHITNRVIQRMIMSTALEQKYLDVRPYEVDGIYYCAYYPSDSYKHKYYCVTDYQCPVELKIKHNLLPTDQDQRRAKLDFKYYPRMPPFERKGQIII